MATLGLGACILYISDHKNLPNTSYGYWHVSMLKNGNLAAEIKDHLCGIGKHVKASDIVSFLNSLETISVTTAHWWMQMMDYHWTKMPSGQYVDGHEQEDIVLYQQTEFLPHMELHQSSTWVWNNGLEDHES